ncbi:MAG TPA: hypothetical protein VNO32_63460 [Candidatus Acidoferrum sp.]|nr:hypothetical protein [Candidatus Acidoferrum sp.]
MNVNFPGERIPTAVEVGTPIPTFCDQGGPVDIHAVVEKAAVVIEGSGDTSREFQKLINPVFD